MGTPSHDRFHVAPDDLTAFAHGEFTEWRRAEISRHVLACESCRETLKDSRDVLGRLAEVGRFGIENLRADVAARRPLWRSRALKKLTTAASIAAVVALGVVLAPPRGPSAAPESPTTGTTATAAELPLTPEQTALVALQQPDGRWAAETALGGARRDDAATGLALLALMPRDAEGLKSGPAARAVGEGMRWLASRPRGPDHAVATCALLEAFALTGDAKVKSTLDRAIRRLAASVADTDDRAPPDPVLGWTLKALERARSLGWRHIDEPIRRIRERAAIPDMLAFPSGPMPAVDAPCALALRVLRDRARS